MHHRWPLFSYLKNFLCYLLMVAHNKNFANPKYSISLTSSDLMTSHHMSSSSLISDVTAISCICCTVVNTINRVYLRFQCSIILLSITHLVPYCLKAVIGTVLCVMLDHLASDKPVGHQRGFAPMAVQTAGDYNWCCKYKYWSSFKFIPNQSIIRAGYVMESSDSSINFSIFMSK